MKNFNEDDFEADLWEVEQTVGDIKKILNGEIDGAQILEREKQKEQRKKNAETLKKIKEREYQEKLLNGTPGKGEGKNYEKFCPFCFYEYQLKELNICPHCSRDLITQEARHKILKQKLEVFKEEKKKKKFRRMKYENWLKSQGEIHILDKSKHGPTNYYKWDMYESESDEDEKQPILPRHDPNFIALEKSMNDDLKKREISQRKCFKLKDEANSALKEKKYNKAIDLYSQAIEECRSYMFLYTNRAFAYMKIENWKNAINDCTKVIEYYELFEEDIEKNLDIYTKALMRKSFCCLQEKNYSDAKECIDKALDYNEGNKEIIKLKNEIEENLKLFNESKKTLKNNNNNNNAAKDETFDVINDLIKNLRDSVKEEKIYNKSKLISQIDKTNNAIEKTNKSLIEKKVKENNYILYLSISGGIECLFDFLNSQANNDSNILTKILKLISLINSIDTYKNLINSFKGYNKLIQFLFTTESKNDASYNNNKKVDAGIKNESKIIINIDQANTILSILESATLNDSARKKICEINNLDIMCEIVLNKYDLVKINDINNANLLSKIYTFICNVCYSSNDIREKIANKISDLFLKQLNLFIDKYNIELDYHRNLLSSILSFIINLANDLNFRKKICEEKKFLKFLSENLLVNLINNELLFNNNQNDIDELYEKTCSLFYNISFIQNEENKIIEFYYLIHIEAFVFHFINHIFNENKEKHLLYLTRSLMLLFRIVKYNKKLFDSKSEVPEKEKTVNNLIKFMDKKYCGIEDALLDYNIKTWVFLLKVDNKQLFENKIEKLIKNCNEILIKDCGINLKGINEQNYQRIVNILSLLIEIVGIYSEKAKECKNIVEYIINICKEKTDLLRKNAAILLARIAKSNKEMEEFVRNLHGMDVLMSISSFVKN